MRILEESSLPRFKRWHRVRHIFVRACPWAKIYLRDDEVPVN